MRKTKQRSCGVFGTASLGEYLSYQVIARKWRPQNFNGVVGQQHISQTLMNALRNDRLPHALLFTGPRGTGKTSSARILAKSLRCPNAVDFDPCNECKECVDITSGRSFDVQEMDGASNNGVESIRELQEGVRSMPSSGKHKLYIIDEVHMLSISAFNALLKTLEEPPSHVIFVLATTEVQKLPNTILSRCQRFDFRRIPVRQVSDHLKHICESDGYKADDESLWMIARQGEGSMRDSCSLLDQIITFTNGDLNVERVIEILGLTDRKLLMETLTGLIRRDSSLILDVVEKIFTTGQDAHIFVQDLVEQIRHLLLVKMNPKEVSKIVDLPDSEIKELAELGAEASHEDIHLLFDMTLKGANEISRVSDPRLVLEMLLMRMVVAPRVQSLAALLSGAASLPPMEVSGQTSNQGHSGASNSMQTMASSPTARPSDQTQAQKKTSINAVNSGSAQNQGRNQGRAEQPVRTANKNPSANGTLSSSTSSANTSSQTKSSPVSSPATSQTTPSKKIFNADKSSEENWYHLVSAIKANDQRMGAQLENTLLVSLDEKTLKLGIPEKLTFLIDQVKDAAFTKRLRTQIKNYWDKELSIDVQPVKKNPSAQGSQPLSPKQKAEQDEMNEKKRVREEVENHPFIKLAIEKLNTRIEAIKDMR